MNVHFKWKSQPFGWIIIKELCGQCPEEQKNAELNILNKQCNDSNKVSIAFCLSRTIRKLKIHTDDHNNVAEK